jgi:peptidoglycan DL-endopeptidase CwlO
VIRRIGVVTMLWCTALWPSRAEDAALSSVPPRLSKLETGARDIFLEDSDEHPSPTPKRHKKSEDEHTAAKRKAHKHSGVETPAASPESDDSHEGREPKSGTKASKKSKRGLARSNEDDAETPRPTPGPAPVREGVAGSESEANSAPAPMATIKPEALDSFSRQPAEVQQLIRSSLALTQQNLNYKYGSADPASGGMDCSGFIYYVLNNAGYKDVPRDSAGQYAWVRKSGNFRAVLSRSFQSFELDELKPGDLLFWSGTYNVDRDIPITHVMIYLGKEKSTGKPVMVGSTDGRSYDGVRRYGVSVFDFKLPSGKPNAGDPDLTARFEGYASIPGLRETSSAAPGGGSQESGVRSQ